MLYVYGVCSLVQFGVQTFFMVCVVKYSLAFRPCLWCV